MTSGCRQIQAPLIKKLYSAEIFVLTSAAGLTVTRYGQPLGGDSFVARRRFGAALSAAQPSYPAQFVVLRSWARLLSNGLDWHASIIAGWGLFYRPDKTPSRAAEHTGLPCLTLIGIPSILRSESADAALGSRR